MASEYLEAVAQSATAGKDNASHAAASVIIGAWERYVLQARPDLQVHRNDEAERRERSQYIEDVLADLTQLL